MLFRSCPGEKVLFWDGQHNSFDLYFYSVDFGDGSPVIDSITEFVEPFEVVAEHVYSTVGDYTAVMTSTNSCGNTLTVNLPLVVDNTGSHKPFYYVSNSTASDELYQDETLYINDSEPGHILILAMDSLNYRLGYVKGQYDPNPAYIAMGAYSTVDSLNEVYFENGP
mgnify:CR=1 FL=1